MNGRLRSFTLSAVALALSASGLSAGEKAAPKQAKKPPAPFYVSVEMQVVTVPEELGAPLVAEPKDRAKVEAAYAKLQALLASGTAQLVAWPMLTMKNGDSAIYEASTGFFFWAEADLAELREHSSAGPSFFLHWPSTITYVTSCNTGFTLNVESSVAGDGKTISLELTP